MKVPLPHAEVAIAEVLQQAWQLSVATLDFIPVGDSAYCYDVHTASGERLFLKVVDLHVRKGQETAARMAFSLPVMEVVGGTPLQDVRVLRPRRTLQGQLSVSQAGLFFALYTFAEGRHWPTRTRCPRRWWSGSGAPLSRFTPPGCGPTSHGSPRWIS